MRHALRLDLPCARHSHPLDEPSPPLRASPPPDGAQDVLLPATLDVTLVCSGYAPPPPRPSSSSSTAASAGGAWDLDPRLAALASPLDAASRQAGATDESDVVKHVFSPAFGTPAVQDSVRGAAAGA